MGSTCCPLLVSPRRFGVPEELTSAIFHYSIHHGIRSYYRKQTVVCGRTTLTPSPEYVWPLLVYPKFGQGTANLFDSGEILRSLGKILHG